VKEMEGDVYEKVGVMKNQLEQRSTGDGGKGNGIRSCVIMIQSGNSEFCNCVKVKKS
jgi:hypothetical protein